MANLNLQTDQRIIVIGGTGDGKTTLALKILAHMAKKSRQKTVIFNPGAEPKLYEAFGEARPDIDTSWPDVQHVAPPVTNNMRNYGHLFHQIVAHGNVLTYIDELALMGESSRYSLWLKYLYQMGRRRNCGEVAVTQRPVGIPKFAYQMSEHFFVGDVRGTDLDHIEHSTGQRWVDVIQSRKQYEFLYWNKIEKTPPRVVVL